MKTARTRAQRREQALQLLSDGLPMSTGLAALLLSVSPKTMSRWCRDGKIGCIRPNEDGGQWRVLAREVAVRLLKAGSQGEDEGK